MIANSEQMLGVGKWAFIRLAASFEDDLGLVKYVGVGTQNGSFSIVQRGSLFKTQNEVASYLSVKALVQAVAVNMVINDRHHAQHGVVSPEQTMNLLYISGSGRMNNTEIYIYYFNDDDRPIYRKLFRDVVDREELENLYGYFKEM